MLNHHCHTTRFELWCEDPYNHSYAFSHEKVSNNDCNSLKGDKSFTERDISGLLNIAVILQLPAHAVYLYVKIKNYCTWLWRWQTSMRKGTRMIVMHKRSKWVCFEICWLQCRGFVKSILPSIFTMERRHNGRDNEDNWHLTKTMVHDEYMQYKRWWYKDVSTVSDFIQSTVFENCYDVKYGLHW